LHAQRRGDQRPAAAAMANGRMSAWAPGFLSGAGSNVEASAGADSDPMSFYCSTSATTWRNPGMSALPR